LVFAFVEVAILASAAWRMWRHSHRPSERWACTAKLREVWSRLNGWDGSGEVSEIARLARREMGDLCVRRLRSVFAMCRSLTVCAICVTMLFGIVTPLVKIIPFMVYWAVCTMVCLRPGMVTRQNTDVWYVAIIACLAAATWAWSKESWWFMSGRIATLITLMLTETCMRLWVSLACSIGLMFFRFHMLSVVSGGLRANYVAWDIACRALAVGCMVVWRLRNLDFWRVHFGERELKQQNVAMTRLLDLLCEVTVELDTALRITHATPKLSAMLMLGVHPSLQGMHLQEFMPLEEDRRRFESFAQSSLRELSGTMPSAMYATLRGPGAFLQVEIFCVQFQSVKGASHLFIGIREISEQPGRLSVGGTVAVEYDSSEPFSVAAAGPPSLPPHACPRAGSLTLSTESDSASEGPPAAQAAAPPPQVLGAPRRRRTQRRLPSLSVGVRTPQRLALPEMLGTSRQAQEHSLVQTMLSWNLRVALAPCCAFHAYLEKASTRIAELLRQRCVAQFEPIADTQCPKCGLLGEDCGGVQEQCTMRATPMLRAPHLPFPSDRVLQL